MGVSNTALAQTNAESLDQYFAGAPIKGGFEKCVKYLVNSPFLSADSVTKRGIYASLRPGIRSHFPFPDSVSVKMLFLKTIFVDSISNTPFDSSYEISIEGVFPDNRQGRRASAKFFFQLQKDLGKHYRSSATSYIHEGQYCFLSMGRTPEFPECSLEQSYYDKLKFYFVLINYIYPGKYPHDED